MSTLIDFINEKNREYFERQQAAEKMRESAKKEARLAEIRARMAQLSEDAIQISFGLYKPDMEDKMAEFRVLSDEIRALEGKLPLQRIK